MAKKIINQYSPKAIISYESPFAMVEAYKAARTSLMFILDSEATKKNSIVFTSYSPMEGKSTVTLNLAITFSQIGAKVLVIDADMRKPSLEKYLDIEVEKGLADILSSDKVDYKDCIVDTKTENLYLLPAGNIPPNPTELLISEKTEKLLEELSPEYDYIFIDSPPLGLVTDAAILGSKTEGIINIVNCEKSKRADISSIKSSLEQANIKLIGSIINNVELDIGKRSNYNSNYYYSNSQLSEKKEK